MPHNSCAHAADVLDFRCASWFFCALLPLSHLSQEGTAQLHQAVITHSCKECTLHDVHASANPCMTIAMFSTATVHCTASELLETIVCSPTSGMITLASTALLRKAARLGQLLPEGTHIPAISLLWNSPYMMQSALKSATIQTHCDRVRWTIFKYRRKNFGCVPISKPFSQKPSHKRYAKQPD
eukprot:6134229-Amphidinium_carterae.1